MSNQTKLIILWAFILHTVWEFGQCMFLYDMWDWPFLKTTIWMWSAVFGDILIVLALWKITVFAVPFINYDNPDSKSYFILILISFAASILLEWIAIVLDLWEYSDAMRVITVFGYEVGLSPILQITFLPAASIYLADRFKIKWKK